jgi:hypothetical protein
MRKAVSKSDKSSTKSPQKQPARKAAKKSPSSLLVEALKWDEDEEEEYYDDEEDREDEDEDEDEDGNIPWYNKPYPVPKTTLIGKKMPAVKAKPKTKPKAKPAPKVKTPKASKTPKDKVVVEKTPAPSWKMHSDGDITFMNKDGLLHREDGPAYIGFDGQQSWYKNGKLHRVDGPAIMNSNGNRFWYREGKCHREDGPAVIYADGQKNWFLDDEALSEQEFLARTTTKQPTAVPPPIPAPKPINLSPENVNGTLLPSGAREWRNQKGELHRENGPALIHTNGDTYWYLNGKYHREDGPAILYEPGTKSFYLDNVSIPEAKFRDSMKKTSLNADGTTSTATIDRDWNISWKNEQNKYHREDGPAFIAVNGNRQWARNGKFHREDGPAIENIDGGHSWYLNGTHYPEKKWKMKINEMKASKKDAKNIWELLSIELAKYQDVFTSWVSTFSDSSYDFQINGKSYTIDGIRDLLEDLQHSKPGKASTEIYWKTKHSMFHRINGPARIFDGDREEEYWLNGKKLPELEWLSARTQYKNSTGQASVQVQDATNQLKSLTDQIEAMNQKIEQRMAEIKKATEIVSKKEAELLKRQEEEEELKKRAQEFLKQEVLEQEKKNAELSPKLEMSDEEQDAIADDCLLLLEEDDPDLLYKNDIVNIVINQIRLGELRHTWDDIEDALFRLRGLRKEVLEGIHESVANDLVDMGTYYRECVQPFKDPPSQLRIDLTSAGYRIAATQLTKATKSILIKALPEEKVPTINSFLDSEIGNGVISLLFGWGLTYAPIEKIQASDRVQDLADEFRVQGLATFGNAAVEALMGSVVKSIQEAVQEIPSEEEIIAELPKEETTPIAKAEILSSPPVEEDEELDQEQPSEKNLTIN